MLISMAALPPTRYAKGPEETIAHHVVGDGPIDLVITIRKPSRSKGQARAIGPGGETELRRRD
jgi:hypothetical protein